jgi:hypothetical protein
VTMKALPAVFDQIQKVLAEPELSPDHPDAAKQRMRKSDAQAALDVIEKRLPALADLALKEAQDIIDLPQLPPDHPNSAALQEAKRDAQTRLLFWNAH